MAVADFEETYEVFTNVVMSGEINDNVPIRVVLFDKESQFKEFAPRGSGAFFSPQLPLDPEPIPTLVMWGDVAGEARLTFQHELTHHLFRKALGATPPWLNEGLADYYATVRIDNGEVYIGEAQPRYSFYFGRGWRYKRRGGVVLTTMPVGEIPKADALFAMDNAVFYEQGNQELDANDDVPDDERKRRTAHYAGAWALVHMLAHSPAYGERWQAFLTALVAGKGYSAAMDEAFGPVMDSIPNAHHDYLLKQIRTAVKAQYTPKPRICPRAEEPVSDSNIKTLSAQLRSFRGRTSKEEIDPVVAMQADLNAAVQLDPQSSNALVHRGLFSLQTRDFDAAAKDLEAAFQRAPRNKNVLIGIARLCSLRAAAIRLPPLSFCETNGKTAHEFIVKSANTSYMHFLASVLLQQAQQPNEAFDHAKLAVKLDPGCIECLSRLAGLFHARGSIREAIALEERALAALPENVNGYVLEARIKQYRKDLIKAAKARKKDAESSGAQK